MRVQHAGPTPLQALNMVLGSIDAVRNARAVYVLVSTLAVSGLLLAQARQALGGNAPAWAAAATAASFLVTFYGSNAVGLMLMDEACGRPSRDASQALKDALKRGHRLLLVVLWVLMVVALLVAVAAALLWATRLPSVGPLVLSIGCRSWCWRSGSRRS